MTTTFLDSLQLEKILLENIYIPTVKNIFVSRYSEGKYERKNDLAPLTIPNGDIGELAVLFATANRYGLNIDREKTVQILKNLVGGDRNISYCSNLNYNKVENLTNKAIDHITDYIDSSFLQQEDISILNREYISLQKSESYNNALIHYDKPQVAVIFEGEVGIFSDFHYEHVDSYIYLIHKTYIDARHRALARELLTQNAFTLFLDQDDEYLYEIISETTEEYYLQILQSQYKNIPVFNVSHKGKDLHIEQY